MSKQEPVTRAQSGELVARLRQRAEDVRGRIADMWGLSEEGRAMVAECSPEIMEEAAARIEYLERERVSLRSGLTRVVDAWPFISGGEQPYQMRDAMQAARAALGTCATLSPATEGGAARG